MHSHQTLAHWSEHRTLVVAESGEARHGAREHQRVFADKLLDLSLGCRSSASYAARMSANSVCPPRSTTIRPDSSEYFAGTARYELSECPSRSPRLNIRRRLSLASGRCWLSRVRGVLHVERQPSLRRVGDAAAGDASSDPKFRVKAHCASSVTC